MSKEKYIGRKYSVQEYDPNWATQYESEAKDLRKVLGYKMISIEHIGSTSVPELAGKPTIDILAVIKDIEATGSFVEALEDLGYKDLGQYVREGSCLFAKEKDGERIVNLHFFSQDHPHINEMIDLRDYLRSHPETVKEYSDLKFKLVEEHPNDYGSYRRYKDEWMKELQERI